MNIIYNDTVNMIGRKLLRPFSSVIPEKYKFPIKGKYTLYNTKGGKFDFICNETSCCGKMLFWEGVKGYEYNITKVFIDLLPKIDVFFDIGSNIGYYSILAKSINPNLKVVAFEPMPSPRKYIEKNILLNHFTGIKVEQLALSNEKGSATFTSVINPKFKYVEDQLAGDGSLYGKIGSNAEFKNVEVEINTLDNYVKENGLDKIDVIKLDVEAHEDEVLSGSDFVLKEFQPIIMCEVLEGRIEQRIEKIILEYGYEIYKAENRGLIKQDRLLHDGKINDYIMIHSSKVGMIEKFIAK